MPEKHKPKQVSKRPNVAEPPPLRLIDLDSIQVSPDTAKSTIAYKFFIKHGFIYPTPLVIFVSHQNYKPVWYCEVAIQSAKAARKDNPWIEMLECYIIPDDSDLIEKIRQCDENLHMI